MKSPVLLPDVGLLSDLEQRFLKISVCSTLAESTISESRRTSCATERIHQRSGRNISRRWLIVRDGQTLCCFEVLWTLWTVLLVSQHLWTVPSSTLSFFPWYFSGWGFCWCFFSFFPVKERSLSVCINAWTIFPLQQVLNKLLGVSSFCPYHLHFFWVFAF